MVIDELIVRKGTTNMPIDSYDNQMIDEIVYEGQKFHFAKQKDLTGTTEIVADNRVQEPLVSLGVKGNTIQSLLPPEYQQVEYIQSTGTQHIDTEIIPRVTGTKQTSIEITYQYTNLTPSFVFGSRTSSSGVDRFYFNYGSTGNLGINVGNGGVSVANGDTNIHTMNIKSNRTIEYDGQQVKITYESFTGTYSVYLFACNQAGSAYLPSQIKLYSCTMTDANGNLVRDYIPCYRKSDNVIGLYDLANEVFYTNQGTGTFKKGNDYNQIPTPEAPIPIQNTGDNGIEVSLNGNTINIPSEVTLTDGTVVPLRFAKYRNADYLSMNNKQVKYFSYSTESDPTKPLSEQVENVPPIEYDLTDTDVGQQLLALATEKGTNILTITSEIPVSQTDLSYWQQIIPNE